jgi:hypothetical protein
LAGVKFLSAIGKSNTALISEKYHSAEAKYSNPLDIFRRSEPFEGRA